MSWQSSWRKVMDACDLFQGNCRLIRLISPPETFPWQNQCLRASGWNEQTVTLGKKSNYFALLRFEHAWPPAELVCLSFPIINMCTFCVHMLYTLYCILKWIFFLSLFIYIYMLCYVLFTYSIFLNKSTTLPEQNAWVEFWTLMFFASIHPDNFYLLAFTWAFLLKARAKKGQVQNSECGWFIFCLSVPLDKLKKTFALVLRDFPMSFGK